MAFYYYYVIADVGVGPCALCFCKEPLSQGFRVSFRVDPLRTALLVTYCWCGWLNLASGAAIFLSGIGFEEAVL